MELLAPWHFDINSQELQCPRSQLNRIWCKYDRNSDLVLIGIPITSAPNSVHLWSESADCDHKWTEFGANTCPVHLWSEFRSKLHGSVQYSLNRCKCAPKQGGMIGIPSRSDRKWAFGADVNRISITIVWVHGIWVQVCSLHSKRELRNSVLFRTGCARSLRDVFRAF